MKTLQELLDEFNETKLGKVKETVISHIVGAQRACEVWVKLCEDRRLEKESDPKLIEEKKLKAEEMKLKKIVNKENLKTRGKTLGSTKGKLNMTDYTREMSKVPTMCPNCQTIGPLSNMKQHHFDNCRRITEYSDNKVIESYLNGMSLASISRESGISQAQVKVIVGKYKKSLVV